MPELPEVELTRRHLDTAMAGKRIEVAEVTHPRTARHNTGPGEVEQRLARRRVLAVERTGKFLHAPLDDGQTLVAHLGMSGRFTVNGLGEPHTHFTAVLEGGDIVRFVDPRTFGFIAVYSADEIGESGLDRLGPDSWTRPVDRDWLQERLRGRTAPIKALLLDQSLISGLGNIYADEALHLASVHPGRPGGSLGGADLERLVLAIGQVLQGAIERGGTSLEDLAYLLPDGRAGDNLDRLTVYGRTDLPCFTCGTPIRRIVIRSRSTHFCPVCQDWGS